MSGVVIRPYRQQDRGAVREIAWRTAFMGRPADAFFSDKELLEDFLTLYFTDHEPESCFVAETGGRTVGYLIGAKDERRIGEVAGKAIVPRLLLRFLARDLFSRRDLGFLARVLRSVVRGEFRNEDFSGQYPAILHINLDEGSRKEGAGSRLIAAYVAYLRQEHVTGVHLATMSPTAGIFFEKQGFALLSRHHRSYFRHITGTDTEVRIYGMKLL